MEKYPSVSIIFVNYNGRKILGNLFIRFLESIRGLQYPGQVEVLAVDNNSDDDSISLIRKILPHALIVKLKENIGYINAVNLALKYTNGDYVLILNNDVILPKNFLLNAIDNIKELGQKYGDVVLAALQIVGDAKRYLGTKPILNVLGQALYVDYLSPLENLTKQISRLPKCWSGVYPDGAAFIISRSTIEKLKYIVFIPIFKMYFDDVELGIRLTLLGVPIFYCKNLIIYHRLYSTSKITIQYKKYINFNINRLMTLLSLMNSDIQRVFVLFLYLILDLFTLSLLMLKNRSNIFTSLYHYLKEIKRVYHGAEFIRRYYDSIAGSSFNNRYFLLKLFDHHPILLPRWLCQTRYSRQIIELLTPIVLLYSFFISHNLYKTYKAKGLRYSCIETLS
ncbi:glycosyltransferase [Pyrobaculum sp.]|uniref:glycosyltransferase family 2 protein n=1 Tax=Pyrobaculum sp. TaxID=2004705 RepID=UPI00317164EA